MPQALEKSAAKTPKLRKAAPRTGLHIEFLAGPDMLDGPAAAMVDVLRMLNTLARTRGARNPPLAWSMRDAGGRAVRSVLALRPPSRSNGRAALPDVLVLPGWNARSGAHLSQLIKRDRGACQRLARVHGAGGQMLALYTGVAMLGEAGLLEGRAAVVPWPFIPSVLRHAPRIQLAEGRAWIDADRIWTADSPALATEMMLRVLQVCGLADLAQAGRAVLLHAPERQRLARAIADDTTSRVGPGTLERARRWLEDHWHQPYSMAAVAQAASTSERSLLRHFRAAFGHTPLQHVHQLRVTHARMLLETTYLPIDSIAERCGWNDTAAMRKVFQRQTQLTPAAYRDRFRLRTRRRQWGEDLGR